MKCLSSNGPRSKILANSFAAKEPALVRAVRHLAASLTASSEKGSAGEAAVRMRSWRNCARALDANCRKMSWTKKGTESRRAAESQEGV